MPQPHRRPAVHLLAALAVAATACTAGRDRQPAAGQPSRPAGPSYTGPVVQGEANPLDR